MITRIEVDGLFNRFNYEIDIPGVNGGVRILTAPNGYGKSTILKIIEKFSCGDYAYFTKEKFSEVRIFFSNHDLLRIVKKEDNKKNYHVKFISGANKIEISNPFENSEDEENDFYIERELPFLTRIGIRRWRDVRTGETFDRAGILEKYEEPTRFGRKVRREEWLENIRKSINVFSIPTNRLKIEDDFSPGLDSAVYSSSMVETIANEVRNLMQKAIRRQFEVGRRKETSFPARLIESLKTGATASRDSLTESIKAVQVYEERFTRLGLVPRTGATNQLSSHLESSETAGMLILKTYLDDIREKFSLLDELAQKLDVFSRSINELVAFKTVETSADEGVIVRVSDGNRHSLPLSSLSSGEQHLIVLIGKLVFNTSKDSLVLIDEPEISFHPEWQEKFLDIIDEIRRLNSFSVLLATHSPILIGDRWGSVIELSEQYNSKEGVSSIGGDE